MSGVTEQCPWCGHIISREKFEEIQASIREDELKETGRRKDDRQLQRKTANEMGDGAEIDLFKVLRDAFHKPAEKSLPWPFRVGHGGAIRLL
jgi:hypothetical protein